MIKSADIQEYVLGKFEDSRRRGEESSILVTGDIARELNLRNRMPMICGVMYSLMNSGDVILHKTPSGQSSTIKIRYQIV